MSKNFDIVIEASKVKEKVLNCVPNNLVNQTNYKSTMKLMLCSKISDPVTRYMIKTSLLFSVGCCP